MRSHAELGGAVHLFSAYLEFDTPVAGSAYGCVQAGITVRLGHGDIVTETVRDAGPESVDFSQNPVAILNTLHDHAKSEQVSDIPKGNRFLLKLAP